MKRTTLAPGMHDKLFKRARVTYEMEHAVSQLLMNQGFIRIETPTLEHMEVFSDQVEPQHYHLFDKSGNLLTLRPDITSQIGRVIASTQVETPIRFSYSGKVFLYQEELRGLDNEHTQAGVEIIGFPAAEAELEAVRAAKEALEVAGAPAYQFEFSHAAILETVFDQLDLADADKHYLSQLIRDKNITGLWEFTVAHPSPFDGFLQDLPSLFGDWRQVLDRAESLLEQPPLQEALTRLAELCQLLEEELPRVTVDLGQLSTMPYYTGITFKVFGDKVPDAFLSGGRYDRLFERFGQKELTAVGWAMDLDSIYQAVHDDLEFQGGGE